MAKKRKNLKEAKAEQAAKRRRARRRKRIFVLFIEIFILLILMALGYIIQKYGKISWDVIDDLNIHVNEGVSQEGYTTVALFGGDSREGELEAGTHSDTIMVVAIDNATKEINIVSIYRDTPMRQESGEIKKANYAYFNGGPQESLNMLNRNLDLDIKDYVTVDFKALADVIDLLGGIEIDVTADEAEELNKHIDGTALAVGKKAVFVSEGLQKLDGVQAVTYARIRKNVGGDYARTERQQLVIKKVVEKVKQTDLVTINNIIDEVFSQVSTSFTLSEIIKLASGVTKYNISETKGFPFEKIDSSIQNVGSIVVPLGFVENVEELHGFLYSKDDYSASSTVREIAEEIENITGYTRADYKAPEDDMQSGE